MYLNLWALFRLSFSSLKFYNYFQLTVLFSTQNGSSMEILSLCPFLVSCINLYIYVKINLKKKKSLFFQIIKKNQFIRYKIYTDLINTILHPNSTPQIRIQSSKSSKFRKPNYKNSENNQLWKSSSSS